MSNCKNPIDYIFVEYKNDNIQYQEIQNDYLSTGNESAWAAMWSLSLKIAKRYIKHEQQAKGFYLSGMEKQDAAMGAVEYVLRRYKTTPGYKIDYIVTAIRFGVMHELYHRTAKDTILESAIQIMNLNPANQTPLETALDVAKCNYRFLQNKKKA